MDAGRAARQAGAPRKWRLTQSRAAGAADRPDSRKTPLGRCLAVGLSRKSPDGMMHRRTWALQGTGTRNCREPCSVSSCWWRPWRAGRRAPSMSRAIEVPDLVPCEPSC